VTEFSAKEWMSARLAAVEERLDGLFADVTPDLLRDVCRYPLAGGGKRIRPLLCLAAAESVGGDWRGALDAGVAIELVHTYSLVHDDLPCMDDDATRRGRPTAHVKFGEAEALLAGDALQTEAFAILGDLPKAGALCRELAVAAGARGMVAGQAWDIGMGGPVTTIEALVRLHRAKTGALLRGAARMGGICGGADATALGALDAFGDAIGLAFQVWDDVLDADQDAKLGDSGPPSYVKLLGKDGAIAAARRHAADATAALSPLPNPAALEALARLVVNRDH
jgi:farnesyl diphosphate synthase